MFNDDDYLGEYMTECPKCGHRYNKRLHGNKCPDCGYRKGGSKFIPYIIVAIFLVALLFGASTTEFLEQILYKVSHSNVWHLLNNTLSIVNPVYLLIVINIAMYICGFNSDNTDKYGNSYQDTITFKEFYRLFTSGFSHADILHIACNMFSLYNLGTFVYSKVGALAFLLIYFACMIIGGFISIFLHHMFGDDYIHSVGASGAVCGLLGFYVVYIIKLAIDPMQSIQYIYKALLPLGITAFNRNIDNLGHLSGLIVGVVLSFLLVNNLSYASVNGGNNVNQSILTNKETTKVVKVVIYDYRYADDVIKDTIFVESEDVLNKAVDNCLQTMAYSVPIEGESVSASGNIVERVAYAEDSVIVGQERIMDENELEEYFLYGNNGSPAVTFSITYTGYKNGEYFERTFYNGIEQ